MRKFARHSCILCSVVLAASGGARAQNTVKDCAPVLEKDYYSYAMKNNLQEDFLRSIDNESYSQDIENIVSKGQAYSNAFSGENDYNKFNEQRNKYLETVHYSRTQQQALDILQITTSERAYSAYESCLRTVAQGPALLVWASRETMNEIFLRVKYVNAASEKGIELYGTVKGGSVAGEPAGMIWSKGPWYSPFNGNKWGVNTEKGFTVMRTPGTAETTITVNVSSGAAPFNKTFKRADAVLTLSYVGTTDVARGQLIGRAEDMPDNNERKNSGCKNFVGLHDGRYCTSRTPMTIVTAPPLFIKSAKTACNPAACGFISIGPVSLSTDGLTASSYVDNWGSPMQVWLTGEQYEHLSATQCGGDQKIGVILGHPVVLKVAKECQPIAQIFWQTLTGIPSQGSVPFSTSSKGGEIVMVGDASDSGSVTLASYKLNKLP